MPYDLRNFIDNLKKAGELIEVDKEVDWNYEISAFEVMSARIGGPAFLFNNIKGIPEGRVLVGHFAGTLRKPHRRIAIALGMNPDANWFTFFRELLPRMMNALRPVEVASGPCKEVIKMGKEVNLLELGDVLEVQYTQVNPSTDIWLTERAYPTMTISSSWMEEEDWTRYFRAGNLAYSKMLIDATTKEEPPLGAKRTCFETLFPEELQKWVVDNWQRLGFTEEVRWNKPWIEAEL